MTSEIQHTAKSDELKPTFVKPIKYQRFVPVFIHK